MTAVYFIRHAEPNRTDPIHRLGKDGDIPLSDKGMGDRALVTHFLQDKNIDAVLSSPYKRAYDTVLPFAQQAGLDVQVIYDFRERHIANKWIGDYEDFAAKQWADFSYKMEDGESLAEVQARNIAALRGVLKTYAGKNIAIGTHGTALSTIIRYYDTAHTTDDFWDMAWRMPWAVKMTFDGERFVEYEKIDLFALPDLVVRCYPYNTLTDYKYTVIFARRANAKGQWEWLYCRHKERMTYETPGGRIEPGETPLECAKRELQEETGAVDFTIHPAFDYVVGSAGQVFLADIAELGELPANSEMAEVKAFPAIPDTMTYPHILPILYEELQQWLAKNTPDEYVDLLDADRKPLGITHKRGEPIPPGHYHVVVRSWVVNSKGEVLITRRCLTKFGSPGMWEIPSGSVAAGETSRDAAAREIQEEAGIAPQAEGELFFSLQDGWAFWDNWLFRYDFDLADVVLLEGETMDARAATFDEIEAMVERGEFIPYIEEELRILRETI